MKRVLELHVELSKLERGRCLLLGGMTRGRETASRRTGRAPRRMRRDALRDCSRRMRSSRGTRGTPRGALRIRRGPQGTWTGALRDRGRRMLSRRGAPGTPTGALRDRGRRVLSSRGAPGTLRGVLRAVAGFGTGPPQRVTRRRHGKRGTRRPNGIAPARGQGAARS
jgi:hypothetical protein